MTIRDFLQRLTYPQPIVFNVFQPTPSTGSYTIATRNLHPSYVASFTRFISLLLRICVGVATLALLWIKWSLTFEQSNNILVLLLGEHMLDRLGAIAEQCEWMYLAPTAVVVLFLVCRRGYTEESLTVLRGLGVQMSTTSSTYLQTPTKRFIPTTSIQDIVIHEAFRGFEVRFYLAIIVKGEDVVVVVFPKMLPRRAILEDVWLGARKCLWEGQESRWKGGNEGAESLT